MSGDAGPAWGSCWRRVGERRSIWTKRALKGVDAVLAKPYRPEELLNTLRRIAAAAEPMDLAA